MALAAKNEEDSGKQRDGSGEPEKAASAHSEDEAEGEGEDKRTSPSPPHEESANKSSAAPKHAANKAADVFVLVNDFSVFSMNDRALWHLSNLYAKCPNLSEQDLLASHPSELMDNLKLLHVENYPNSAQSETTAQNDYTVLLPATHLHYLYAKYRVAISLDLSSSMMSVDSGSACVYLDQIMIAIERVIMGLAQPLTAHQNLEALTPRINLSVVAQGFREEAVRVFVQGVLLSASNAQSVVSDIRHSLLAMENDWAASGAMEKAMPSGSDDSETDFLATAIINGVFALNGLPFSAAPTVIVISDCIAALPPTSDYDNILADMSRHDIVCHVVQLGGGFAPEASYGYVPDTDTVRLLTDTTKGVLLNLPTLESSVSVAAPISMSASDGSPGYSDSEYQPIFTPNLLQRLLLWRYSAISPLSKPSQLLNLFRTYPHLLHSLESTIGHLGSLNATSYGAQPQNKGIGLSEKLALRPSHSPTPRSIFPWIGPPIVTQLWRRKVQDYRIRVDLASLVEVRIREGFVATKFHVVPIAVKTESAGTQATGDRFTDAFASHSRQQEASKRRPSNTDGVELEDLELRLLLHWQHEIWIEYTISTKSINSATSDSGERELTSRADFGDAPFPHVQNVRTFATSDLTISIDVLAGVDFLRAMQSHSVGVAKSASKGGTGARSTVHLMTKFVRDLQEVDRVLVHLNTISTSMSEALQLPTSTVSGATIVSNNSKPAPANLAIDTVLQIVGNLSLTYWHRWFYVERFEVLSRLRQGGAPSTRFSEGLGLFSVNNRSGRETAHSMHENSAPQSYGNGTADFDLDITVMRHNAAGTMHLPRRPSMPRMPAPPPRISAPPPNAVPVKGSVAVSHKLLAQICARWANEMIGPGLYLKKLPILPEKEDGETTTDGDGNLHSKDTKHVNNPPVVSAPPAYGRRQVSASYGPHGVPTESSGYSRGGQSSGTRLRRVSEDISSSVDSFRAHSEPSSEQSWASQKSRSGKDHSFMSFCLVKIAWETPQVAVVHMAFFLTPAVMRHKIVGELQEAIMVGSGYDAPPVSTPQNQVDPSSPASTLSTALTPASKSLTRRDGRRRKPRSSHVASGSGSLSVCPRYVTRLLVSVNHSPSGLTILESATSVFSDKRVHEDPSTGFRPVERKVGGIKESVTGQRMTQQRTGQILEGKLKPEVETAATASVACCGGSAMPMNVLESYLWHNEWTWELPSAIVSGWVIESLSRLRIKEGFTLVDSAVSSDGGESLLLIKQLPFYASRKPSEFSAQSTGSSSVASVKLESIRWCLLQYRIRRISATTVATSLWMEPQSGFVDLPIPKPSEWTLGVNILHDILHPVGAELQNNGAITFIHSVSEEKQLHAAKLSNPLLTSGTTRLILPVPVEDIFTKRGVPIDATSIRVNPKSQPVELHLQLSKITPGEAAKEEVRSIEEKGKPPQIVTGDDIAQAFMRVRERKLFRLFSYSFFHSDNHITSTISSFFSLQKTKKLRGPRSRLGNEGQQTISFIKASTAWENSVESTWEEEEISKSAADGLYTEHPYSGSENQKVVAAKFSSIRLLLSASRIQETLPILRQLSQDASPAAVDDSSARPASVAVPQFSKASSRSDSSNSTSSEPSTSSVEHKKGLPPLLPIVERTFTDPVLSHTSPRSSLSGKLSPLDLSVFTNVAARELPNRIFAFSKELVPDEATQFQLGTETVPDKMLIYPNHRLLSSQSAGYASDDELEDEQSARQRSTSSPPMLQLQSGQSPHSGAKLPKATSIGLAPVEREQEKDIAAESSHLAKANVDLYEMLKQSLQLLCDCETEWVSLPKCLPPSSAAAEKANRSVSSDAASPFVAANKEKDCKISVEDLLNAVGVSRGQCFAKVLGPTSVLLCLLPDLSEHEDLRLVSRLAPRVASAGTDSDADPASDSSAPTTPSLDIMRRAPGSFDEVPGSPSLSLPNLAGGEVTGQVSKRPSALGIIDGHKGLPRKAADDFDLSKSTRRRKRKNFRESYMAWRMGGDSKEEETQSQWSRALAAAVELERERLAKSTLPGCDKHLIPKEPWTHGFLTVGFYHCSRLHLDVAKESVSVLLHPLLSGFQDGRESTTHARSLDEPSTKASSPGFYSSSLAHLPGALSSHHSQNMHHTLKDHLRVQTDAAISRFREKVQRVHEQNFSRAVYMLLRENGIVDTQDLQRAIDACVEVPLELDVSLLAKFKRASAKSKDFLRRDRANAEQQRNFDDAFLQELLRYFKQIPGTNYMYYAGSESAAYMSTLDQEDAQFTSSQEFHAGGNEFTAHDTETLGIPEEPEQQDESSVNPEIAAQTAIDGESSSAEESLTGETASQGDESRSPASRKGSLDNEVIEDAAAVASKFSFPFFLRIECVHRSSTTVVKARSGREGNYRRERRPDRKRVMSFSGSGLTEAILAFGTSHIAGVPSSARRTKGARAQVSSEQQNGSPSASGADIAMPKENPQESAIYDNKESDQSNRVEEQEDSSSSEPTLFPSPSSDRTMLRLVCITLPSEKLYEQSQHAGSLFPAMGGPASNIATLGRPSTALNFEAAVLPDLHKKVMQLVTKRFQALISTEILLALLQPKHVSKREIGLVQRLMQNLSPESVTHFYVPFQFLSSEMLERTSSSPGMYGMRGNQSNHSAGGAVGRSSAGRNSLFNSLPPDSPSSSFHQDREELVSLFKEELMKAQSIRVAAVGQVYIVFEQSAAERTSGELHDQEMSGKSDASRENLPGGGEGPKESFEPGPHQRTAVAPPYWAVIQVADEGVYVSFHHPPDCPWHKRRLDVLTSIRVTIMNTMDRVNQLILLSYLHETRTCSNLLLPPTNEDRVLAGYRDSEELRRGSGTNGGQQSQADQGSKGSDMPRNSREAERPSPEQRTRAFSELPALMGAEISGNWCWPGQFGCEMQFETVFWLHDRLSQRYAISQLVDTALHPFQISNRKQTFVYRDKRGRVYYMKISGTSQKTQLSASGRDLASPYGSQLPFLGGQTPLSFAAPSPSVGAPSPTISLIGSTLSLFSPAVAGITPSSTSGRRYGGSGTPGASISGIVLRVYGVEEVGVEISHDFCKWLERKLDDLTLSVLSTLLIRNPHFKLTTQDLAFLRPELQPAHQTLSFQLPQQATDEYLFLLLLRQNIQRLPLFNVANLAAPLTAPSRAHSIAVSRDEDSETVGSASLADGTVCSVLDLDDIDMDYHPAWIGYQEISVSLDKRNSSPNRHTPDSIDLREIETWDPALTSPVFWNRMGCRRVKSRSNSGAQQQIDPQPSSVSEDLPPPQQCAELMSEDLLSYAVVDKDFWFIYNSAPDTAQFSEGAEIGKGMAFIQVTACDSLRRPISFLKSGNEDLMHREDWSEYNRRHLEESILFADFDEAPEGDAEQVSGPAVEAKTTIETAVGTNAETQQLPPPHPCRQIYYTRLQVWSRGGINATALLERLKLSVVHALSDYAMESVIRRGFNEQFFRIHFQAQTPVSRATSLVPAGVAGSPMVGEGSAKGLSPVSAGILGAVAPSPAISPSLTETSVTSSPVGISGDFISEQSFGLTVDPVSIKQTKEMGRLMRTAMTINNPSVQLLSFSETIPSWLAQELIQPLQHFIHRTMPTLLSEVFFTKDDQSYKWISNLSKGDGGRYLHLQVPSYRLGGKVVVLGWNSRRLARNSGSPSFPERTNDRDSRFPVFSEADSMLYPVLLTPAETGNISTSTSTFSIGPTILYGPHLRRNSFLLLDLTNEGLKMTTYNWSPAILDHFEMELSRLLFWSKCRVSTLDSILLQKLHVTARATGDYPSNLSQIKTSGSQTSNGGGAFGNSSKRTARKTMLSSKTIGSLGLIQDKLSLENLEVLQLQSTPATWWKSPLVGATLGPGRGSQATMGERSFRTMSSLSTTASSVSLADDTGLVSDVSSGPALSPADLPQGLVPRVQNPTKRVSVTANAAPLVPRDPSMAMAIARARARGNFRKGVGFAVPPSGQTHSNVGAASQQVPSGPTQASKPPHSHFATPAGQNTTAVQAKKVPPGLSAKTSPMSTTSQTGIDEAAVRRKSVLPSPELARPATTFASASGEDATHGRGSLANNAEYQTTFSRVVRNVENRYRMLAPLSLHPKPGVKETRDPLRQHGEQLLSYLAEFGDSNTSRIDIIRIVHSWIAPRITDSEDFKVYWGAQNLDGPHGPPTGLGSPSASAETKKLEQTALQMVLERARVVHVARVPLVFPGSLAARIANTTSQTQSTLEFLNLLNYERWRVQTYSFPISKTVGQTEQLMDLHAHFVSKTLVEHQRQDSMESGQPKPNTSSHAGITTSAAKQSAASPGSSLTTSSFLQMQKSQPKDQPPKRIPSAKGLPPLHSHRGSFSQRFLHKKRMQDESDRSGSTELARLRSSSSAEVEEKARAKQQQLPSVITKDPETFYKEMRQAHSEQAFAFRDHYVQYLEKRLGFARLQLEEATASALSRKMNTEEEDNIVLPGPSFLYIHLEENNIILMLKLDFETSLVCITLFSLTPDCLWGYRPVSEKLSVMALKADKNRRRRYLLKQIMLLRDSLLLASSVYDFIIQRCHSFITQVSQASLAASSGAGSSQSQSTAQDAKTGDQGRSRSGTSAGLPEPSADVGLKVHDLGGLLATLAANYRSPPPGVRNLLVRRYIELPIPSEFSESGVQISATALLGYISCHANRYGVDGLLQYDSPHTVCITSTAGKFTRSGATSNPEREQPLYSLTMTIPLTREQRQENSARGGSSVEKYTDLQSPDILNQQSYENSVLLLLLRVDPAERSKDSISNRKLGEDTLSAERVMDDAETFALDIVKKAGRHFFRDSLWARLLGAPGFGNKNQRAEASTTTSIEEPETTRYTELRACLDVSVRTPVHQIDPALFVIHQLPLPYEALETHIMGIYKNQVRRYSFAKTRHLLLLCPMSRDLMIHIGMDMQHEQSVVMEVCRRESPSSGRLSGTQQRAVTEFIQAMCSFLWRNL